MAVQVLIVDDHASFRRLARLLLLTAGFDVVGEATDAQSARALIERLDPDAVLLDVMLPDGSGVDVARELAGQPGPPRVLLTSSRSRSDFGPSFDLPGGCTFIPKHELSGPAFGPAPQRGVMQRTGGLVAFAAVLAPLTALDAARQARLGIADAATWVTAAATYVALAAAVLIARWPERRRTAFLMIAWLLAGIAIDAGPDWPYSELAVTVGLLALAMQAPLYAHMVLSYPSGRVRDRLERGFLATAYLA